MVDILSDPAYFLPPLLGVAITLGLLVIALLLSRRDFSTWLFCGLLISMVLVNSLLFGMRASPDLNHALTWERAMIVPTLAIFVFYYHFTLTITNNRGQRHILRACYLFLVVLVILSPTDLLVKEMRVDDYGYDPVLGVATYPLFVAGYFVLFAGSRNVFKSIRLSTSAEERKRLIYLLIAAVFPLIGAILDGYTEAPPSLIWCNLIFCILCSIAILKYNLLDIRVVVRKSLVYLLVSAIAAIPYVSILFLVSQFLGSEWKTWWIHAVILLLLAVVLRPLYGWAQNLVDRLFYRGRYDYLRALEQFGRETRSIANPEELGSTLVSLVRGALRSSMVCLLLPTEGSGSFVVGASVGLDEPPAKVVISGRGPLLKWLRLEGRILSSGELNTIPALQSLTQMEMHTLRNLRAELCVPIKTRENELSAVLVLGEKLSQQPYLEEDKQLLTTLAGQMAMNLENARLYEEARESEEKIREREKEYRELAESIGDIFFAMNDELRYTYWNKASEEFTGIRAKDALGKHLYDIFPDSEATRNVEEVYRRVLNTSNPQHIVTEYQLGDKDFVVEISAYPLKNGISVFVKDVTEQREAEDREKRLQQELDLSGRLAAIGELAAGVAHEINNPLTGILGFSQRLLRKSTDKETKGELEIIHSEAQRAATVVQSLLAFARPSKHKVDYSDTNDIVQKSIELRAYELRTSNIEVVTELTPNLPTIQGDFQQIQEVFLNIILNAEQAMSEVNRGGKLSIKTEEANGYIRITFTDDGPGIAKENLDKLFDPFFTMRGDRGGTGLGLSICHGIVTEHGGRIYAKSKPGKGATFFIELPITRETTDKNEVGRQEAIRE